MSIIQEIQAKALNESRIKAQAVNSFKVVSVRPNSQLSALIEVLAFLVDKSPSDFIYSNFGKALSDFVLQSKEHIEPLHKVVDKFYSSDLTQIKPDTAISRLISNGVIEVRANENEQKHPTQKVTLLSKGFNKTHLEK